MKDLTELEICKRIAEIEGFLIDPDDKHPRYLIFKNGKHVGYKAYNPLTDDGLWANLITKYEVSISFNFCLISMITNKQYEMNFSDIPSLKRKSLLLIIESHKDV